MSEQYFLEKCIITVEDTKGSYEAMAILDIDVEVKKMYRNMLTDITNHLYTLDNRLKHLKQANNPNTQQ
ncbi:MAG: hypothetical protein GX308_03895 [Epulopiscium sp.]|nr:hypothetical protein [Candidatus Epulonipiscium sp.]